nr:MAG TPA: hypothetical protein [Caudoviricetes sp.]
MHTGFYNGDSWRKYDENFVKSYKKRYLAMVQQYTNICDV